MFMTGVVEAYERIKIGKGSSRNYYFFDSFEGFTQFHDKNDTYWSIDSRFSNSLRSWTENGKWRAGRFGMDDFSFVKSSFKKNGLLDGDLAMRVHLVKGYFENVLPNHARKISSATFVDGHLEASLDVALLNSKIAMLRMDGDLYSSTNVALQCLYPYVSMGGFVVVDDYDWGRGWQHGKELAFPCREAVTRYRSFHNIADAIRRTVGLKTKEQNNGEKTVPYWIKTTSTLRKSGECEIGDDFRKQSR